jgi:hypothetical protein
MASLQVEQKRAIAGFVTLQIFIGAAGLWRRPSALRLLVKNRSKT